MPWRDRRDYVQKVAVLDPRVRPLFEDFLDELDRNVVPFALGDTRRDLIREWELWKHGRTCPAWDKAEDPKAWIVTDDRAIVTRVPPGSGKGPHPYGLAADVFPLDERRRLMDQANPRWDQTIQLMWTLAETCGLDALGHRTPAAGDEYWSGDPSHFQVLGWRALIQKPVAI